MPKAKPKRKPVEPEWRTPGEQKDEWGVCIDLVLSAIHDGSLKASNIARSGSRPRWRIAKADAAAYMEARSNQQKANPKPARRRPRPAKEYI